MTTIEHKELRGITIRNLLVTIVSTASIVGSVMTTYFGLKDDIRDIRMRQENQARINEVRLKILEDQVGILQQQLENMKTGKQGMNQIEPSLTNLAQSSIH